MRALSQMFAPCSLRRVAFVAAVLAVAAALVATHGVIPADHMEEGAAMCLAVLEAPALAMACAAARPPGAGRAAALFLPGFIAIPALRPPARVRTRDGPVSLQVLRL